MCGICGIVDFNNGKIRSFEIDEMKILIKHRGPDDDGTYINHNLGLGFVRLSILDLSKLGHQPMHSVNGRYVVVFNGEIFNYIELRESLKSLGYSFSSNSDTEVLLNAYQEWGEDVLNKLNGMWAFTIYDKQENTLFGARDRYGIKPFYYSYDSNRFAFASEIPPILNILDNKATPDDLAIFDYLMFNRTDQTDRTFFKEINKLQHGHYFKIDLNLEGSNLDIQRWYNLKNRVKSTVPFENPKEYRKVFNSSIGLRLRSDVPVGVCLSGGLDSSSIVTSLITDHKKKNLNTFSAVYNEGQTGDESRFINLYKSTLDNMHFIYPTGDSLLKDLNEFVAVHAEPIPTTGPYAQYKVMELAKDYVTVTLDGQGADECLGGYHYFFGYYYKDLLLKKQLSKLCSEMKHYRHIHKSSYAYKTFLFFLLPKILRTKLRANESSYIKKEYYNTHASNTEIAGDLYNSESLQDALIDHFEFKLEHLLKWEDRNSMKFSLEARVPFLDYRLVEKTLALKSDLIINEGMTKYILREAMKNDLPSQITNRVDKTGFSTPQDEWFRSKAFQNLILEIIHSDSFKHRPFWDQSRVVKIYNRHLERKGNYSKEIWKWLHLELWFQKYID